MKTELKNRDFQIREGLLSECIKLAHEGRALVFKSSSDHHSLGLAFLNYVSMEKLLFSSKIEGFSHIWDKILGDEDHFDLASDMVVSGNLGCLIERIGEGNLHDFRVGLNLYFDNMLLDLGSEGLS